MNAKQLIALGFANIANLPIANPDNLEVQSYVLPLIAHDYPAKTAVMWNACYREFRWPIANVMLTAKPDNLQEIFTAFKNDPKYLGGGAGVGFKVEVLPFLNEVDELANAMCAVNFILKTENGGLKGYNTDGLGFAQSLADRFSARGESLSGKKVVILGAGGAGNAIVFALAQMGARLVIINRTVVKAQELADKINAYFGLSDELMARADVEDKIISEVVDADALVNVSTKGSAGDLENYSALAPAVLPVNEENIKANRQAAIDIFSAMSKNVIIADIVLVNGLTPLLSEAESLGLEILDGKPMVINQAVEAFWLLHQERMRQENISKDKIKIIMSEAAE